MKLFVFTLFAILLSLALSAPPKLKGGTNCRAHSKKYGPECSSDTSSLPHPGATLQYLIDVEGSVRICCKAYTCYRYYPKCTMQYIGCGINTWSSANLPWEDDNTITPKLQCKTYSRWAVSYTFTTIH